MIIREATAVDQSSLTDRYSFPERVLLVLAPDQSPIVFQTISFGGVLVSTGWQEVQIACRGWSAGHVKSRPQLQLPKLSFLWPLS